MNMRVDASLSGPARGIFDEANRLMRDGKNASAATHFKAASNAYYKEGDLSGFHQAYHIFGINLRLAGELENAKKELDHILYLTSLSNEPEIAYRIANDLAMVYFAMGDLDKAASLLETQVGTTLSDEIIGLSWAVAAGFLARVYSAQGKKAEALDLYEQASMALRGRQDVYEMNLIIWWLKELPLHDRLIKGPHAAYLALKTRHRRRFQEALLLTLSPWLYSQLKERSLSH